MMCRSPIGPKPSKATPIAVVFRADLPKTPVGKILRRELRDLDKKAA